MKDKFVEALKVSGKSKFKRIQPTFSPNRDIDDPSLYRAFKIDFDHFIADVDPANWADKTRWIKQCVKEDAYHKIKEVTLNEAGYKEAFKILDAKYLCTNKIKDDIFHFIHTFSIPNTGKNHSTLSSKLTTLNNYIKELTSSHGFVMSAFLHEFIGHIIIRGLPNDVKNQFFEITNTLYPDYNAILSKVEEVIQKLNRIGLNTKDSTMKQNPNNSNSNSSKAQSINSVTIQPNSSSKTGNSGKKSWKKSNCRFCQSAEHTSTKCTKYLTPKSRIAALRSRFGSDVCQKCTRKHTGACRKYFWGYCTLYKSCKENPHHFSICPNRGKTSTSKSITNPLLVETVVAHPICNANVLEGPSYTRAEGYKTKNSHDTNDPKNIGGLYVTNKRKRSVALETATFTAFNDSCSNLPIHERGVSALLDTGAQRSMVTSATVERLGLETVEREAATLQGFGNLRPVNKIYDIVRVNLGKVDFKPI